MNILQKTPKPHPQTAGRVIDEEAVLILADASQVQVLNAVGARIFELSDGSRTVAEIITLIEIEFEVEAETARRDTIQFLEDLVAGEVIVWE